MKNTLISAGALGAALFISGCATPAAYTDPSNGKTNVVSMDKINVQDWGTAADQMIQSLLASRPLQGAAETPAVMAIDRIVNKTSDANLDTSMLEKKIRVALNQSGKVLTTTTYGNKAESAMAKDALARSDFLGGDRPVDRTPDFTLTGRIIEDTARAGNTRQVTYVFQLSLTDTRNGLAVWEDEKMIQKTGSRSTIGW